MPSPASIDSSSESSDDGYDSDDSELRLAKEEWEESVRQLQTLLSVVLLPYFGKFLGRKWAHWAYARYLRLGLGLAFVFGENSS